MKHYTLPILLVLTMLLGLRLYAHAADLSATTRLYLPLVLCPSCTGTAASVTPTPSPAQDAAEVIRLVNIERAKVNCPAVKADINLVAATQAWAEYQRTNSLYEHASADWYAPYGYPTGVLENIGGGGTAKQIVEAWMASAPHRRNLLWCYDPSDPSYHPDRVYKAGAGHAGPYWVWGLVDFVP